ncbi:MAG: hypothetical protein U0Q15_18345 [Kineosporiaceae bacterium]
MSRTAVKRLNVLVQVVSCLGVGWALWQRAHDRLSTPTLAAALLLVLLSVASQLAFTRSEPRDRS